MNEFKLVPVEPTLDMLSAGLEVYGREDCAEADVLGIFKAMLAAAPAVQGEPVAFDEDAALSLAERVFYTEIDEQLATDIVRYARRLHTLYTAPQPAAMPPEIPRELLGTIIDEVFDGPVEDVGVIEDIYRAIARHFVEQPEEQQPDVTLLLSLLEHARCNTCDGSGVFYDGRGQPQCQWCHDRSAALAAHRKGGE